MKGLTVRSSSAALACALALAAVAAGCGGDDDEAAAGDGGQTEASSVITSTAPDREQQLLECAKKESGPIDYYASSTDTEGLVPLFEKAYPDLDVELVLDPANIASRFREEVGARAVKADLFEDVYGSVPRDEEIFQKLWTPRMDEFREGVASDYYVSRYGYLQSVAINTENLPEDQVPESWQDLLDPALKGKIYLASDASVPGLLGALQAYLGDEFIDRLAEQVRPQQVATTPLADLLVAGEVPVAVPSVSIHQQLYNITEGAPLEWIPLDPMKGNFIPVSITKDASNPCGAALLLDWALEKEGEAQKLRAERGQSSPFETDPLVPFEMEGTDMSSWQVVFNTDPKLLEGHGSFEEAVDAWNELYETKFLNR
jgi:iron(III) transport system substrate-binding protein